MKIVALIPLTTRGNDRDGDRASPELRVLVLVVDDGSRDQTVKPRNRTQEPK